jgi:hypothetical protein
MDAGPGYGQAVLLDKELGQLLLVETGIGRGRQLHHLARQLRVECVHGTATTIAVGQSRRSKLGVGSLHPLQLTH